MPQYLKLKFLEPKFLCNTFYFVIWFQLYTCKFINNHKHIVPHDLLCEMTTKQYLAACVVWCASDWLAFPENEKTVPMSLQSLKLLNGFSSLTHWNFPLKWSLVQTIRSSLQIFKHKTTLKMPLP